MTAFVCNRYPLPSENVIANSHAALCIRMAWSTDVSNTAPSTLHVTNTAPFSHRITQQPYATVFYSVIRAKTDLRRSPFALRVGLVYIYTVALNVYSSNYQSSTWHSLYTLIHSDLLGMSLFVVSLCMYAL